MSREKTDMDEKRSAPVDLMHGNGELTASRREKENSLVDTMETRT